MEKGMENETKNYKDAEQSCEIVRMLTKNLRMLTKNLRPLERCWSCLEASWTTLESVLRPLGALLVV